MLAGHPHHACPRATKIRWLAAGICAPLPRWALSPRWLAARADLITLTPRLSHFVQ
jgi:hypothetical protein